MTIYVVKDKEGFLHVIHGMWSRAVEISYDGDIRIYRENEIDDLIYNRLQFEDLEKF